MTVLINLMTANIAAMRRLADEQEKALWEFQIAERYDAAERICRGTGFWGANGSRGLTAMAERRSPGGTKHRAHLTAKAATIGDCIVNATRRYPLAELVAAIGREHSFEGIVVDFAEYFDRYFGGDVVAMAQDHLAAVVAPEGIMLTTVRVGFGPDVQISAGSHDEE